MKTLILATLMLSLAACSANVVSDQTDIGEAGSTAVDITQPVTLPSCVGLFQDPEWYIVEVSDPNYKLPECNHLDAGSGNLFMCHQDWCAKPGQFTEGGCPVCPQP